MTADPAQQAVVRALLDQCGQTYAEQARIKLADHPSPLYRLRGLHDEADGDAHGAAALLTEFPGVGPAGASIFLREVQGRPGKCQVYNRKDNGMAVTAFGDLPLADRDREWDGAAAERRVRKWAGAEDEPNQKYRDAHVWYDADSKDHFTAYKLLIADVIGGKLKAVPRGVMAAGNVMQGSRGGVDLPQTDIGRVKSHLAKYYQKMGDEPPWDRD